MLKAFATPITLFGGGNGGNFAPSLFAGGVFGYLFALVCSLMGFQNVPVSNLILAGMAGVMSGVLYAPLTAIFLIAESSLGYDLFIPLMIVSVISYLIAKRFSPISPELRKLADEGKIFTKEHDKNLLSLLQISDMVDYQSQKIPMEASLANLLDMIKTGNKNVFAIVDNDQKVSGVLTMDDVRQLLFISDPETVRIVTLMKAPPAFINIDDETSKAIKIFDETGSWQLPVIDKEEKFIGFISKSNILSQYRRLMQAYSED